MNRENHASYGKKMGDNLRFHSGRKFTSYVAFRKWLAQLETHENQRYSCFRSSTLQAVRLKREGISEELKFYQLHYICRQKNKTIIGCPAFFKLKVSRCGQFLKMYAYEKIHNHTVLAPDTEMSEFEGEDEGDLYMQMSEFDGEDDDPGGNEDREEFGVEMGATDGETSSLAREMSEFEGEDEGDLHLRMSDFDSEDEDDPGDDKDREKFGGEIARESASNSDCLDDDWDDTALIKAYDKAVTLAKDVVAKRIGVEATGEKSDTHSRKEARRSKSDKKWSVGSPCGAVYHKDGNVYEAIITKIFEKTGTCIVKFVGYGNDETVELSELCESKGLQSQIEQQRTCQDSEEDEEGNYWPSNESSQAAPGKKSPCKRMDCESELPRSSQNSRNPFTFNSAYGMMPPAPPPPPQLMAKLPDNDADALSSMLMSWYISGFHTGYYHGIKQARHKVEKRKKSHPEQ